MIVAAILDYIWTDKRTRVFRHVRVTLFVVLAVLMGMTTFASYKKYEQTQMEAADLRSEIAEMKAVQMGGDSYCYLFPPRLSRVSDSFELMLLCEGKYPAYDVTVRIEDVPRLVGGIRKRYADGKLPYNAQSKDEEVIRDATKSFLIGNVGPKQAVRFGTLPLSGATEEHYNVYIMARNGQVFEQVFLRRVSRDWKLAYRVGWGGAFVRSHVDPDFPRKGAADPW
jgi:hypothetical protein